MVGCCLVGSESDADDDAFATDADDHDDDRDVHDVGDHDADVDDNDGVDNGDIDADGDNVDVNNQEDSSAGKELTNHACDFISFCLIQCACSELVCVQLFTSYCFPFIL